MREDIDIGLIRLFDEHLAANGMDYSASIVGGVAILLVANGQRPTGDIDSLLKIPDHIKEEIRLFSEAQNIKETWFNDNASRNFGEFVKKGEEVFAQLVFSGKALKLYTPSIQTLLLSKIYPMLDRPEEGKDLQDIESLVSSGVVKKEDLEKAVDTFEFDIRYEDDRNVREMSRELVKVLREFIADAF